MRKLLLLTTLLLFQAPALHAAMVYYYDESGEIHYVNTNITSVPPQYLDQVRPQLEAIAAQEKAAQEEAAQQTSSEQTPAVTPEQTASRPVKVILLTNSYDRATKRMMMVLNANKIHFKRYDILGSSTGRKLYDEYNRPDLPAAIINDTKVMGNPFLGNLKKALHDAGATHVAPR